MTQAIVKIDPKYLEIIRTSLVKTGLPKPFVQEVGLLNCNIAETTFLDLEDIEPKLGYVSQEKNEVLSNLMDAGKLLFGKLNEKTWVDNWLKLDVQVYLRDL